MIANTMTIRRESLWGTIPTEFDSEASRLAVASLQGKPKVAKWKGAVESVNQLPVTSINDVDYSTYTELQEPRLITPAVPVRSLFEEAPQISFEPLQEWEGCVVEISTETFTATLVDITARRKFEEEIAEFAIQDVSNDDVPLLKTGAIFRWLIGYERHPSGTKRRVSSVVFRRLPIWSEKALSSARGDAKILVDSITWD